MTQREAFEDWWQNAAEHEFSDPWAAWQAATRHAAQLALVAPCKTDRQDQREACANAILGGMECRVVPRPPLPPCTWEVEVRATYASLLC